MKICNPKKVSLMLILNLAICLFATSEILAQNASYKSQTYVFKKGHFLASPWQMRFYWDLESIKWRNCFDSTARYVMQNADSTIHTDQYDWLKLPGLTFTPWFPHGNTAMVGWRYNHLKDSIELNTYMHVDGGTFFKDNPHLTVGIGEHFEHEISLNYEKKQMTVTINTARGTLSETMNYIEFQRWTSKIQPYFGGTSKAPHDVKVTITLLEKKHRRDAKKAEEKILAAKKP